MLRPIDALDTEIEAHLAPFDDAVARLDEITREGADCGRDSSSPRSAST